MFRRAPATVFFAKFLVLQTKRRVTIPQGLAPNRPKLATAGEEFKVNFEVPPARSAALQAIFIALHLGDADSRAAHPSSTNPPVEARAGVADSRTR